MPSRPQVLVIAELCNPDMVSVPLVGWSHVEALRRVADVHLCTQVRNKAALEKRGWVEGRDFTSIDTEFIAKPVFAIAAKLGLSSGKAWTLLAAMMTFTYPVFERLIWKRFKDRIRSHEFDVVHRITPLSPTCPSPLARRCRKSGVPFILGPLNGGVPWPKGFDSARRKEREWLSYVREAYNVLPGIISTRKHASAILVASMDTWRMTPAKYHPRCVYIPENAIDPARFARVRERRASLPLRVVFVGRLVPYKGADMLLEAAAPLVRDGKLEVTIIGDGPERQRLADIVARENLGAGVKMPGWVPHEKVGEALLEMDVLGFPSIREFGGGVVLEAMAVGLVPLLVNYGGPAELVTPATALVVPIGPRDQIIRDLRDRLLTLASDPSRIDDMSARAVSHAREKFTWDAKAAQVVEIYRSLMSPGTPLPAYPFPSTAAAPPSAQP